MNEDNVNNKINKKKKKKFFRFIIKILFLVSLITLGSIFFLDVLPFIYFLILIVVFVVFDLLSAFLLLGKGYKKRLTGFILSIIAIIFNIFLLFNSTATLNFLNKINAKDYITKNYSVLVLKSSEYNKLKDIKDKELGIIYNSEDEGIKKAEDYLNKKVSVDYIEYEDLEALTLSLKNQEVEAILIEDSQKDILEEDNSNFIEDKKIIYKFSVDIPITDDLAKEVDISSEPFNLYISGIDTYGKITSVSRSDVNMVVSVNPKKHEVLLSSIPRDYYVKLHGIDTTYKDKLTHAGIHGIDVSIKTVEDLLDIDINYYAKVNFTSLINLVDELGGIDVETDKTFTAYYVEDEVVNYTFKQGINHLNGKQALSYARERKSLASGDLERTLHQQQILEAILNKVTSKSVLTKYNSILNSLNDKVVTNVETKNITKLVKKQLKENQNWEIKKNTLTGTNSSDYTYSYKSQKSYVMIPDEDAIKETKELIDEIFQK